MPDSTAEAALEHLASLWQRERETTRARFAAERRQRTLDDRVAARTALRDLYVDETAAAPGDRVRLMLKSERAEPLDELRIGPGDPVVLWRRDPEEPDAVAGVVARPEGDRLAVIVEGEAAERIEERGLRLDREAPQATFDRGARAIAQFRRAGRDSALARLRGVVFGDEPPRFGPEPQPSAVDEGLNDAQLAAVRRALAARDVALVHGPPGTGKTRTLVEVVRQAVARGDRVLVVAASNTAVDNLAERLAVLELELVRLGHPARVAPAMEARTLDALMQSTEQWRLARAWIAESNELRRRLDRRAARGRVDRRERRRVLEETRRLMRDARRQLSGVQRAIVDRCPVVCATAAGADTALLGGARFELVVLDEATQAPDPIALVALARAERAVLAGDPCQLPPTVVDPRASREGLAQTLFERLVRRHGDRVVRMLEVQYRMHETLMQFPSQSMYSGRLRAAPEVAGHRLEQLPRTITPEPGAHPDSGIASDPLRPGPLVYVDTSGKGWNDERGIDDPSTRNPAQAERVVAEVRRLLDRGLCPTQLAVITPYDAQARLLREQLADARRAGVEIGTVDGFQGREKEAVVVDLVRCNEEGDIGFLRDTRRMNVALTRARRFLLVVGDSATLAEHPYYRAFLDAAEAAGAWTSAWADDGTDPI